MLVLDFAQALKLSISRVLQLPVLSWLVSVEHQTSICRRAAHYADKYLVYCYCMLLYFSSTVYFTISEPLKGDGYPEVSVTVSPAHILHSSK